MINRLDLPRSFYNKLKHLIARMKKLSISFDESQHDCPIARVNHETNLNYLAKRFNKKGKKVLEIGSRVVTGPAHVKHTFSNADYVGFDYYPGENVDVVGDAHKLSSHFKNQKFDLIYSRAVFEHFAMPWVVAIEICKLLEIGGYLFIETHFSFSAHERPWHFFQFSDMGMKVLFSPALGFECLDAGFYNPITARFANTASEYLKGQPIDNLYCHVDFLARKVKEIENFDWMHLSLDDVVAGTIYPNPQEK